MYDPVLLKHIFSVHVNNIEVYVVVNDAAERFNDVKMSATDDAYLPANGISKVSFLTSGLQARESMGAAGCNKNVTPRFKFFFFFDKYHEFPKIFSERSLIIFVGVLDKNLKKNSHYVR